MEITFLKTKIYSYIYEYIRYMPQTVVMRSEMAV